MATRDDLLVAAGLSVGPGRWLGILDELLAQLPRVNCWRIAEHAGDVSPDGMRHLLARAKWDADGVRDDVAFAAKPQLARWMIERAVTAAVLFGWVAGDEVYGDNGPLRGWLDEQGIAYVLAVACHHRVPAGAGHTLRSLTSGEITRIGHALYDLLRGFSGYRAAVVGRDPESQVDPEDLEADWRNGDPPRHDGLVLADDLCERWRHGQKWTVFTPGYRWLPYSGSKNPRVTPRR